MTQYTLTLKEIIDNGYNIFDFDYTLYDGGDKTALENEIKDFYYLREMGAETVDRFLFYFRVTFLKNLKMYNVKMEAYTTTNIEILNNMRTHASNKNIFNDTPDNKLTELVDYATNITENEASADGKINAADIELLNKFVDGYKNLTGEFINSLNDCFMQIF